MITRLDTRDLYKRQCELESLSEAVKEAEDALKAHVLLPRPTDEDEAGEYDEEMENLKEALDDAKAEFGTDEAEELDEISEVEGYAADFMHGTEMIATRDFEEYAEELAEEMGEYSSRNG